MIRILERIEIHPVAKFKRNRSDWDEFFRLLLAILSSLQGYEANRGMGARRGTAGSGSSLWAEGFGLRAKAGDKMKQTCITLAIISLIPISASASGLT